MLKKSPKNDTHDPMNREELEFLPAALEVLETPPHPAGRSIALVICAVFVFALAWAMIGEIDTVAVAEGKIVPTGRVKLVQPLETGIVRKILVEDGQFVKEGDELVKLDPTEADANLDTLRYELMKERLDAANASALLSKEPLKNFVIPMQSDQILAEATKALTQGEYERHQAEIAAIDAEIDERKAALRALDAQMQKTHDTLPLVKERLEALEGLFEKGFTNKPLVLSLRQELIAQKAELKSTQEGKTQMRAKMSALKKRRAEVTATFRAENLKKRTEALRKMASLEQQIKKELQRQGNQILKSPVTGTVVGLSIHTIGGVVGSGDVLMKIVPKTSMLEVEAMILNKDIGFVKEGQDVELKLEAFPFTKYGLIPGKLKHIWHDAEQDERHGLVYKAVVTLSKNEILVGNKWVKLTAGMSAQAEIKTGKRKIIEYFLSPFLKYQQESLRER